MTVAQKVLDSLKFPLMKMFKARKATMATFKFVADELERENVSLKKNLLKLGGRLTSATGGWRTLNFIFYYYLNCRLIQRLSL